MRGSDLSRRALMLGLLATPTLAGAQRFRPGRAAGFQAGFSFLGGSAPWTPAALASGLLTWLDVSDPATITTPTGVSSWLDKARARTFVQATAANQPVVGTGQVQFDGTNDLLAETDVAFAYNSEATVPDGRGGRGPGLGFSLTHICPDPNTGGFVFGNDGRATDPQGAGSMFPSLMFVDVTGATKIRETALSNGRSCQGVAVYPTDPAYVWAARPSTGGDGTPGSIQRVHGTTGVVAETVNFDANGMTVVTGDPLGEGLYFIVTDAATGQTFNFLRRDGSVIRTAANGVTGGVDGIWWDAQNQWLWCQANSSTYIYSIYGKRLGVVATGATFNRGEGVCRVGDKVYITHNGSYHASGTPAAVPNVSRMFTYTVSNLQAVARDGAHYAMFFLGRHNGTPAANRVLMGHANPLSGLGLSLFSTSAPGLTHYANTGVSGTTEMGLAAFTGDPTTRAVYAIVVDAVAETATLRINSVAVSTVSIAAIAGGRVVAGRQTIGGSIESGAPARWSKLFLTEMFEYLGETALPTDQLQKAEAYLARHDPLGTALANLDAGNPYKTVAF